MRKPWSIILAGIKPSPRSNPPGRVRHRRIAESSGPVFNPPEARHGAPRLQRFLHPSGGAAVIALRGAPRLLVGWG